MRRISSAIVIATAAIAYACGSDNAAKKDAGHDSHVADAVYDAGMDAHFDAPISPGGSALTVKNYAEWCLVSIGSGSALIADVQTVYVAPGMYTLTATPNGSGFELGSNMWHHTDGDIGSGSGSGSGSGVGPGEAGSQTGSGSSAQSVAHVTVGSAAKCVWVCCPVNPGGTGCPATDYCP
jgi:hypothetical protein